MINLLDIQISIWNIKKYKYYIILLHELKDYINIRFRQIVIDIECFVSNITSYIVTYGVYKCMYVQSARGGGLVLDTMGINNYWNKYNYGIFTAFYLNILFPLLRSSWLKNNSEVKLRLQTTILTCRDSSAPVVACYAIVSGCHF